MDVHRFDPYSQALSKIERGFVHDLADVEAMLDRGLVERDRLTELYEAIEPHLTPQRDLTAPVRLRKRLSCKRCYRRPAVRQPSA